MRIRRTLTIIPISDLTLFDVSVSVSSSKDNLIASAGALAGYNHAIISDVYVTNGTITGTGRSVIGGIVGSADYGRIENSSSSLTIKGSYISGGIIGSNTISVISCRFTGWIIYASQYSDHDIAGGIAGLVDDGGVVRDCTNWGLMEVGIRNWNSKTLQPYMGGLVGYLRDGTVSDNTQNGEFNFHNLNLDNGQQHYCNRTIGRNDCE